MRTFDYRPLWIAAFALYCGQVSLCQSADALQSLFKEGAASMHSGDAAAAETAFRKATELDPAFAPAFLDLGLAQLKEGKLLEAMTSIRKSLELDPSSPGAHLFLGIAEYQSNDLKSASSDLHTALQQDPNNVQVLTWLGIVTLNSGQPVAAVQSLDRAAQLAPTDENVLDYQVQAHMAAARESYNTLFKLNPSSWRLHRLNAAIDAQAMDHSHAVEEYQAAIHLDPKEAELYEGLGWEYRQLGHADLAAKAFSEQLRLTPGNPIAMYNLASAQVDNGQESIAVPLLEDVTRIYNHPTGADYYLGRALAAEGKDDQAATEFLKATNLEGEMQKRAWYELSQLYRRLGRTGEARAALIKFQQLKQAADEADAKQVEDWRKLDTANTVPAGPGPK